MPTHYPRATRFLIGGRFPSAEDDAAFERIERLVQEEVDHLAASQLGSFSEAERRRILAENRQASLAAHYSRASEPSNLLHTILATWREKQPPGSDRPPNILLMPSASWLYYKEVADDIARRLTLLGERDVHTIAVDSARELRYEHTQMVDRCDVALFFGGSQPRFMKIFQDSPELARFVERVFDDPHLVVAASSATAMLAGKSALIPGDSPVYEQAYDQSRKYHRVVRGDLGRGFGIADFPIETHGERGRLGRLCALIGPHGMGVMLFETSGIMAEGPRITAVGRKPALVVFGDRRACPEPTQAASHISGQPAEAFPRHRVFTLQPGWTLDLETLEVTLPAPGWARRAADRPSAGKAASI